MMSLLMSFIFFFIVIFKMNYLYMFMFMQNMILLFFMYFMVKFSLNFLIWVNLYNFIGVDIYSWSLILLSMWIMFLMMLFSNKMLFLKNFTYYMILMILMMLFLLLCFMSLNVMMFYIWFESSLIPVFLLIMGWGVQPERIQAGFYMMMYTLFGSMPLFFMIIYLYLNKLNLNMDMLLIKKMNVFIYLSLMLGFLIKMPMYMFHLWLPKAHVEAPVMGSMILAGVMLKLGTYGILRIMMIMMHLCVKFNKFFMIISLIGGLISSMICLFQIDMKMLVAYSSIVHMSVLLGGLMTLNNWGYMGAIMMMLAHGLCSSGLFSLVNMSYERFGSRSLYINKGMLNYFPSLSLMWFLLCSSNLSFPPSLNLFSEIMLISSLIIWLKLFMLILMPLIFFSACYTLYLYSFSQHGKLNYSKYLMEMISVSEYFNLLMHWIPLNLLFLMMMIF